MINMARFYVENKEHKWNIFSSIVDDFLYDDFVDFDILKSLVIKEAIDNIIEEKEEELNKLSTGQHISNKMSYEEAIKAIEIRRGNDNE